MFPPGGDTGGAPPQSIGVPAGPAPGGPPEQSEGESSGGGGSPDELVSQAIDLIRQALDIEPDHEDKLLLEKITTMAQQYLATQQKTLDTAMGAGPGIKAVRKASSGSAGAGGGGGY